jgi:hypothetical protein
MSFLGLTRRNIIGGLHKVAPLALGAAVGLPMSGMLAGVAGQAIAKNLGLGGDSGQSGGSSDQSADGVINGTANKAANWRPTITPEMMQQMQIQRPQMPPQGGQFTPDMLRQMTQIPQFGQMANMQRANMIQSQMPPSNVPNQVTNKNLLSLFGGVA